MLFMVSVRPSPEAGRAATPETAWAAKLESEYTVVGPHERETQRNAWCIGFGPRAAIPTSGDLASQR